MPYSALGDLLVGGIPLPTYLDAAKYVADAADEIDSYIGNLYVVPVDINAVEPELGQPIVARPAALLLKRINNHLATGRLILAIASPSEQNSLHAYGQSLVKESLEALRLIASGEIVLDGAPGTSGSEVHSPGPLISNLDAESNVEAFYGRIANPSYAYPDYLGGYYRSPDGFIN